MTGIRVSAHRYVSGLVVSARGCWRNARSHNESAVAASSQGPTPARPPSPLKKSTTPTAPLRASNKSLAGAEGNKLLHKRNKQRSMLRGQGRQAPCPQQTAGLSVKPNKATINTLVRMYRDTYRERAPQLETKHTIAKTRTTITMTTRGGHNN